MTRFEAAYKVANQRWQGHEVRSAGPEGTFTVKDPSWRNSGHLSVMPDCGGNWIVLVYGRISGHGAGWVVTEIVRVSDGLATLGSDLFTETTLWKEA
jgi:hypothetical protein